MIFLRFSVILALQCVQQSVSTDEDMDCEELPEPVLSEILGPAYNSRYMSLTAPSDDLVNDDYQILTRKRTVNPFPPFFVDEDYAEVIAEEPAWNVSHVHLGRFGTMMPRDKRQARGGRQWECEWRTIWTDLGPDYFPRYLRSVECESKSCWYGHFRCKPRSFAVKILRRRRGYCTPSKPGLKLGTAGLPGELRQLWVWEERAVNFCCHCSP